jgi:hypothetical protein
VTTPIPARSSRPKGTDQLEIEWRFDAPDLAAAASWLAGREMASSNVTVVEGKTKALSDTYHDTKDWRVYRAGYALRVREGDGPAGGFEVTFKSLAAEEGGKGESKRREVTEKTQRGDARDAVGILRGSRGPAGELFRTFAGTREAAPIFALRNRRRTFDLVLHEDAPESGGLVVDASGDIRERGSDGATGTEPPEIAGITVDAADDIREGAQEPADGPAETEIWSWTLRGTSESVKLRTGRRTGLQRGTPAGAWWARSRWTRRRSWSGRGRSRSGSRAWRSRRAPARLTRRWRPCGRSSRRWARRWG